MTEITLEEKKQLMIEMLKEIDIFCRSHDIHYFLVGGTLLGAVRHNGYIPWDDDIDIALLREDYDRLISEFTSTTGNINIYDYKNKKNFIWPAAKIVHNKTILVESGIDKSGIGVFLDMFPLDTVCGTYENAKQYVEKVWFWRSVLTLKHLQVSKERTFIKNALIVIAKLLNIVPDYFLISIIEKMSRKYANDKTCKYICNFAGAWGTREIALKDDFNSAVEHLFESFKFYIPVGYDDYLTTVYGDYMTPPPKEKQISTHTSKEFWIA